MKSKKQRQPMTPEEARLWQEIYLWYIFHGFIEVAKSLDYLRRFWQPQDLLSKLREHESTNKL